MRRRGITRGVILLLGALVTPAPAQEQKPAGSASAQGTGVVPPGVKLAPEMPAGAAPRPFRFPKASTRTLSNGLRVFVVSDSRQPAVTVRLVLTAAGSTHDPAGRPGVAAMTANLLTQGTAKRSAAEIAEAIDFVGGTLSAAADSDATYVTASVVKKDLDLAMDLLSDVVLHPAFLKEELERRRQQLLSNLEVEYADPEYLAAVILYRVVYGAHPYGLPDEGTPDSARKFDRDDLVRFRETYYVPNRALLAFAGDITPDAAFAAAARFLGDESAGWKKKDLPVEPATLPKSRAGLQILLVDKPDAVQTQIRVGTLGIERNSPDYIPLLVTNRIFGGGFNSRLSTEVRIHKGLTYGAYSQFESRAQAGSFVAQTSTRTEATAEAARLVVDLLARMAAGTVAKDELDFATAYLAGVFPIQSETPEQVAGRVLTVAQYDLPADYNDTYREKVLGVGTDLVKKMAARYFPACDSRPPAEAATAAPPAEPARSSGQHSCGLDLVLVGNVKAFRDALQKAFPGAAFREIPFDEVDLLSSDLRRAKQPPAE